MREEAPSLAPGIVEDLMALMGLDLMVARSCEYFYGSFVVVSIKQFLVHASSQFRNPLSWLLVFED